MVSHHMHIIIYILPETWTLYHPHMVWLSKREGYKNKIWIRQQPRIKQVVRLRKARAIWYESGGDFFTKKRDSNFSNKSFESDTRTQKTLPQIWQRLWYLWCVCEFKTERVSPGKKTLRETWYVITFHFIFFVVQTIFSEMFHSQ